MIIDLLVSPMGSTVGTDGSTVGSTGSTIYHTRVECVCLFYWVMKCSADCIDCRNIQKSVIKPLLKALEHIWAEGSYDGILGFSNGAAAAFLLAAHLLHCKVR